MSKLCSAAMACAVVAAATPAAAHHMMDGQVPSSFLEGLLSGLGHPVIGPDHLAFILAIGLAAALVPAGIGVIGAFIAASTAGVLVHVGAFNLPMVETLVAGSVVVAGLLVAAGRASGSGAWLALSVVAGLLHGYAFGETIVGVERGVIGAYLLGLGISSGLVALAVRAVAARIVGLEAQTLRFARVSGLALGGVGLALLMGTLGTA